MYNQPVSCLPTNVKMSKAKKVLDDAREIQNPELDLCDKGIATFEELPGLFNMRYITRLTLSHNKIRSVPAGIAVLENIEIFNLFNNQLEELPMSISSMAKLRILNLGMNRLNSLPRGFGACTALEVLDLTYNNLNENSLPSNFFMLETLRALYLGDNDFEVLPPQIGQLKNLQIVSTIMIESNIILNVTRMSIFSAFGGYSIVEQYLSRYKGEVGRKLVLRDNDLIEIPKEIGELSRLRELHLQANRLTLLPPELGNLDFTSEKSELKLHLNEWVAPINDQMQGGTYKIMEYIRSETYRFIYNRQKSLKSLPPPKMVDKSKKLSRLRQQS